MGRDARETTVYLRLHHPSLICAQRSKQVPKVVSGAGIQPNSMGDASLSRDLLGYGEYDLCAFLLFSRK